MLHPIVMGTIENDKRKTPVERNSPKNNNTQGSTLADDFFGSDKKDNNEGNYKWIIL